jgi:hypothetical protein
MVVVAASWATIRHEPDRKRQSTCKQSMYHGNTYQDNLPPNIASSVHSDTVDRDGVGVLDHSTECAKDSASDNQNVGVR